MQSIRHLIEDMHEMAEAIIKVVEKHPEIASEIATGINTAKRVLNKDKPEK